MKKTIVLSIGIVLLGVAGYVLLFGISFTTDISDKEEFWGGYQFEKEYILLRDVFLQKTSGGMASRRLILIPEESFKRRLGRHEMAPVSIAEYESDPENAVIKEFDLWNWKIDVVGIVRKGTHLRTVQLDLHKGWSWFFGHVETLTPWAEILDGEHAGKIVDINDISIYYRDPKGEGIFMYRPEDNVIELSIT